MIFFIFYIWCPSKGINVTLLNDILKLSKPNWGTIRYPLYTAHPATSPCCPAAVAVAAAAVAASAALSNQETRCMQATWLKRQSENEPQVNHRMQSHGAPGGACATPSTVRTCWLCGRRGVCAMCIVNRFALSMGQPQPQPQSQSQSASASSPFTLPSRPRRSRCQGQQQFNSYLALAYLRTRNLAISLTANPQWWWRGKRGGKQQYAGPNSAHALPVRAPNVGQEGKSRAHLSLVAYIQRQLRGVADQGQCEQQTVYGGREWMQQFSASSYQLVCFGFSKCVALRRPPWQRKIRAQHVQRFVVIFCNNSCNYFCHYLCIIHQSQAKLTMKRKTWYVIKIFKCSLAPSKVSSKSI